MTDAAPWIAKQDPARQADLKALAEAIHAAAPDLPVVAGAMLAFGPFRYRYASGREGDSALVSIASGKTGISVYVNAVEGDRYVAEEAAATLGKAKVGKSCIRFRKLADLDLDALARVVRRAVEVGGAGQVS